MVITRDWTELNPELLCIITKKLEDISNFIRFRAVCKNWRSRVGSSDAPPQLPWLIENRKYRDFGNEEYHFYSLYDNKTHSKDIPESRYKIFRGPSKEYLLLNTDSGIELQTIPPFLLNPITRTRVPLPLKPACFYTPIYLGSPSIPASDNNVLSVILLDNCMLSVMRSNEQKWTYVDVPFGYAKAYYKGSCFICECKSPNDTLVIDVTTGDILSRIPTPDNHQGFNFLIEASDHLLGVVETFSKERGFVVYQLEEQVGGEPRWARLSSIGDRMLFLERGHGICTKASDFDGFRGNCIYWHNGWDIYKYCITQGRSQVLHRTTKFRLGSWFVPMGVNDSSLA